MIELSYITSCVITYAVIIYILYWLYNLEKINCDCAMKERKIYIKYFWYFILILNIIILIYAISNNNSKYYIDIIKYNYNTFLIYLIFTFIINLLTLLNAVNTYKYINELKECSCSNTIHKKIIYYYSLFSIIILSIFLFIYFILNIFFIFFCDGKKCYTDVTNNIK